MRCRKPRANLIASSNVALRDRIATSAKDLYGCCHVFTNCSSISSRSRRGVFVQAKKQAIRIQHFHDHVATIPLKQIISAADNTTTAQIGPILPLLRRHPCVIWVCRVLVGNVRLHSSLKQRLLIRCNRERECGPRLPIASASSFFSGPHVRLQSVTNKVENRAIDSNRHMPDQRGPSALKSLPNDQLSEQTDQIDRAQWSVACVGVCGGSFSKIRRFRRTRTPFIFWRSSVARVVTRYCKLGESRVRASPTCRTWVEPPRAVKLKPRPTVPFHSRETVA